MPVVPTAPIPWGLRLSLSQLKGPRVKPRGGWLGSWNREAERRGRTDRTRGGRVWAEEWGAADNYNSHVIWAGIMGQAEGMEKRVGRGLSQLPESLGVTLAGAAVLLGTPV